MYEYTVILKALDLFKIHKSKKKVSKILNISRSTIVKWIRKYFDNLFNLTAVINKTYKPINKIINVKKEIKLFIYQSYIKNPFYTRKDIQFLIKDKFNIKYGLKKLKKIINLLNLTYKKAKYTVVKNIDYIETLKKDRKEFENKIKIIDINKIICIDESSFNSLFGTNLKGHSLKGTPLYIPVNEKKFKNNSLLMALSISKIIYYETHLNKIDSNIFKKFIETIINKEQLIDYTFVFDNVSFHKSKQVLDLIKNTNNNYLFTPKYSPNNNPIENMFGIIKNEFKKQIINDIVNQNILSKKKYKLLKINKKIKLIEISNEKINIKKNDMNDKLLIIKNENCNLKKSIIKEIIKQEKKNLKNEYKEFKKKEKIYIKNELKKEDMSNIIKTYIIKSIEIIKEKYKYDQIIKIFNHAFSYNYENIEKEIRDRIFFLRN